MILREGSLIAIALMVLPFIILSVLTRLLPPWWQGETQSSAATAD